MQHLVDQFDRLVAMREGVVMLRRAWAAIGPSAVDRYAAELDSVQSEPAQLREVIAKF